VSRFCIGLLYLLPPSSISLKILLLQLKRIGDLILTTPAIAALRANLPDAQLTLVVSNRCADLLPAIGDIDRLWMTRRSLHDLALFFTVAREKFDYCIDFTRNDRSAFLTFLSRARTRAVSYRVTEQSKNRARAYNEFVNVRMRDMHTIDYHLALLEPLKVRVASHAVLLNLPETARVKAELLRRDANIRDPFVIFHPGSARREKFWEPGCWAKVIEQAGRNHNFNLVLTGRASPFEQGHLAAIKNQTQQPVIDLSGKTDLLTLAALIGQARLLVTVDSAPMHLAEATQTPQVVLFGPTNPFHWRPLESPALILQGEATTAVTRFSAVQPRLPMRLISTEAVIGAMDSLLSFPSRASLHEQRKNS
jgi:lipopolysaccharide heptosyltransferase III